MPTWISTACYAGYWCDYEIQEKTLYFANLYINAKNRRNYPPIYNVAVSEIKNDSYCSYLGIHHQLSYSGRLVIVRQPVGREEGFKYPRLYTVGLRLGWAYKEVLELVFELGALVSVINHGQQIMEIRKYVSQSADVEEPPRYLHYPAALLVGLWWMLSG